MSDMESPSMKLQKTLKPQFRFHWVTLIQEKYSKHATSPAMSQPVLIGRGT